jgi:hypothetical protein
LTVWVVLPWLVQLTVAPVATWTSLGENRKSPVVIETVPVAGIVAVEEVAEAGAVDDFLELPQAQPGALIANAPSEASTT